jgi:hypothetical protein
LKLNHDELLTDFAFNFNTRPFHLALEKVKTDPRVTVRVGMPITGRAWQMLPTASSEASHPLLS